MGGRFFDALLRLAEGDAKAKEDLGQFVGATCDDDREANSMTSQFIRDSLRYRGCPSCEGSVAPPPFVRFSHSRPSFQALSADQLSWYLWWRERWSSGADAPSSDGYRCLLAFELLNLTWQPDGACSLDTLTRLAGEAEDHSLRRTMRSWSGDLAWELGLDEVALCAYEEARSGVLPSVRWRLGLASEYSPRRLSELVASRQPESTYAVERRRELNRFFRSAMMDADAWFRERWGCWLSEALGRRDGVPYEPYAGAIVHRPVQFRPLITCELGAGALPYLVPLMRHLENLHRRAGGVSSRLKEQPLPEPVLQFVAERAGRWRELQELRSARAAARVGPLRRSLVTRLARESDELHQFALGWLEVGERPYGPGGLFDDLGESRDDSCPTLPGGEQCSGVRPARDQDALREGGVPDMASELIALFSRDGRLDLTTAQGWARSRGVMLVAVLDPVNTLALDLFDAPVIVEQGGILVIDGEIADQLPGLRDSIAWQSGEREGVLT